MDHGKFIIIFNIYKYIFDKKEFNILPNTLSLSISDFWKEIYTGFNISELYFIAAKGCILLMCCTN